VWYDQLLYKHKHVCIMSDSFSYLKCCKMYGKVYWTWNMYLIFHHNLCLMFPHFGIYIMSYAWHTCRNTCEMVIKIFQCKWKLKWLDSFWTNASISNFLIIWLLDPESQHAYEWKNGLSNLICAVQPCKCSIRHKNEQQTENSPHI
jgi:hypothetical protein